MISEFVLFLRMSISCNAWLLIVRWLLVQIYNTMALLHWLLQDWTTSWRRLCVCFFSEVPNALLEENSLCIGNFISCTLLRRLSRELSATWARWQRRRVNGWLGGCVRGSRACPLLTGCDACTSPSLPSVVVDTPNAQWGKAMHSQLIYGRLVAVKFVFIIVFLSMTKLN